MGKTAYKSRALLLAGLFFVLCFFILNANFNAREERNMLGSLVRATIWYTKLNEF
jgi:hypothetical protein